MLSDTVREYFEESFPENENTSSSWLAKEAEYAEDDTDDQGDLSDKDQDQSECKSRLLMPMYRKSSHSSTNNVATNNGVNESRLSDNVHASSLENTRNTTSRPVPVGKRQRNCLPSESIWESQPKKSSVYLFCDSLAMQIEEAQLTPRQLSSLQIDLLKTLQEYLPTDK